MENNSDKCKNGISAQLEIKDNLDQGMNADLAIIKQLSGLWKDTSRCWAFFSASTE